MRVLIVAPYFYPSVGGLENYALACARGLFQKGHRVLVATSGEGEQPHRDMVGGVEIVRLATTFRLSNTPVGMKWTWSLQKVLREFRPDIVNAHLPVPGLGDLVTRLHGDIPVAVTYHNDLTKPGRFGNALAVLYSRTILQGTLRRAAAVVVTSDYYADRSAYLPASLRRCVVPIGIDLDRFRPEAVPCPGIDSAGFRLLFVGSLKSTHRHKGVDVLLRAVALLRHDIDVHLTLVGDGDALPAYRAQARDLGLEDAVAFAGRVSDDDLPGYYTASDLLVLPSTSEAEGFGIVVLEAQACGTPVLATSVGGVSFALRHGETGTLTRPNDPAGLADSMRAVHADPVGTAARAAHGRSVVCREYSKEVQVNRLNDLLLELVGAHDRG